MNYKDKALIAAMSFDMSGKQEKVANYTLNKEDLALTKVASLVITNPTEENIDSFIRRYVSNELAEASSYTKFDISLIPQNYNDSQKGGKESFVTDASGLVKLKVVNKTLEIPFVVRDSELLPFDVIQLDGRRIPYSRENLKKVIFSLDAVQKNQAAQGTDSPYLGLERAVNPSTSTGFLGNIMQLQDTHYSGGRSSGYVTASVEISNLLEKTAKMNPLTIEHIEKIRSTIEKVAHDKELGELAKIASEVGNETLDESTISVGENFKNRYAENGNALPHGTVIVFPEIKDNQIGLVKGIILSKFRDVEMKSKVNKFVLTEDGRIILLQDAKKFLCYKDKSESLSIPTTTMETLKDQDRFVVIDKDIVSFPLALEYSENYKDRDKDIDLKKISISSAYSVAPYGDEESKQRQQMYLFDTDRKFAAFTPEDALELIQKGVHVERNTLEKNYITCRPSYKHTKIVVSSKDTKIVKIKDVISNPVQDVHELDNLLKMASFDDESFEKIAASEQIKLECTDRRNDSYKLTIDYIDRSNRIFKSMQKVFNRISKVDVQKILGLIGFNIQKIGEIIYKARNNNYAIYSLPYGADLSKLEGGNSTNMSIQALKNTVTKFVSPDQLATAIAMGVTSKLVSSAVKGGAMQFSQGVANDVRQRVAEYQNLSSTFEKLAKEHEDEICFNTARLMALNSMLSEKTASTLDGTAVYPRIKEVAAGILDNEEFLSKVAYDLMAIKYKQADSRNIIVSPAVIQCAIEGIDNLYKMAYAIEEGMTAGFEKEAKFGFGNKKQNFNARRRREGEIYDFLPKEASEDNELSKEAGLISNFKAGMNATAAASPEGAKAIAEMKQAGADLKKLFIKGLVGAGIITAVTSTMRGIDLVKQIDKSQKIGMKDKVKLCMIAIKLGFIDTMTLATLAMAGGSLADVTKSSIALSKQVSPESVKQSIISGAFLMWSAKDVRNNIDNGKMQGMVSSYKNALGVSKKE